MKSEPIINTEERLDHYFIVFLILGLCQILNLYRI